MQVNPDPSSEEYMVLPGHPVYVRPKQDLSNIDAESGIGEMEEKEEEFEKRMNEQPIIDMIYNDGSWEQDSGTIALKSLDELGSVIVGAVLKKTISQMLETDEAKIVQDPAVSSIYPSHDLTCITVSDLDLCVVVPPKKTHHGAEASDSHESVKESREKPEELPPHPSASGQHPTSALRDKHTSKTQLTATNSGVGWNLQQSLQAPVDVNQTSPTRPTLVSKESVHIKWDKPMKPPAEEESDADSLLDSDEDFEERDSHFRRNKNKWHSLSSWKGIQAFREFLAGTSGEKYWNLWIDIDKGRLIHSEEDKQR